MSTKFLLTSDLHQYIPKWNILTDEVVEYNKSMPRKITKYVVGFMFNKPMTEVALIKKRKPAWQAGKLNGIGGHVENRESARQAMSREFIEEAGIFIDSNSWQKFCIMDGINNDLTKFNLEVFFKTGNLRQLISVTDEKIKILPVEEVLTGRKTIGNVPWLVALAIDFGRGVHPPSVVKVLY